jgi:hypothetical protein
MAAQTVVNDMTASILPVGIIVWVPTFVGMTMRRVFETATNTVIPAKAGIQASEWITTNSTPRATSPLSVRST